MISKERAAEIAGLYYDNIYQLCHFRLHDEETAHDVTQNVFLFFQEHCDELDDVRIKKWLYAVTNIKIKEQFREIAKREKEILFGSSSAFSSSAELVYEMELNSLLSDEEIEKKKKSILESLTEKELELFEAVYIKHMKYAELAKALNISENALKARVFRLVTKIKEKAYFAFMAVLLLLMKI
ncbi:MAG: sigma-70 family RNA polymerase sigma factor [Clostridia bacterium]|nr:sigma-70 family RNA polymerase sigma factor [Clostridia bacterium]